MDARDACRIGPVIGRGAQAKRPFGALAHRFAMRQFLRKGELAAQANRFDAVPPRFIIADAAVPQARPRGFMHDRRRCHR
jgi:hypothetical protein